jgi:hypothetical protein
MARRGRPRKFGSRHSCGKLQQPTAAERQNFEKQMEEADMQVVLNQSHRRGNRDQLCESPLGRFFLENTMIRRELREAGIEYANIKRRWRAVKGIPTDMRLNEGSGDDPSDETIRRWENQINLVETSIKHRCPRAFGPFVQIAVDERPIRIDQSIPVMFALHAAAIALGMLDDKDAPWGC